MLLPASSNSGVVFASPSGDLNLRESVSFKRKLSKGILMFLISYRIHEPNSHSLIMTGGLIKIKEVNDGPEIIPAHIHWFSLFNGPMISTYILLGTLYFIGPIGFYCIFTICKL